jgi:tRNA-2-methylthio-N6-dimethylallyladenosine synthase
VQVEQERDLRRVVDRLTRDVEHEGGERVVGERTFGRPARPRQPGLSEPTHASNPGVIVTVEQFESASRGERPVGALGVDATVAEVIGGTLAEDGDRKVGQAPGDRRHRGRLWFGVLEVGDHVAGARRHRRGRLAPRSQTPAPGDRLPQILGVGERRPPRSHDPPVPIELFDQLLCPIDVHPWARYAGMRTNPVLDADRAARAPTSATGRTPPVASYDVTRRYFLRTYGCQMNEHDSERIAGLLEADGLERTHDEVDADIVVLNTCCIRENADNKLYGKLGHLKGWKDERDGRQIVVAGCLAQKDRDLVRQRAGHVDVVLGTHNVHRAAELIADARAAGPITEILDEAVVNDHLMFPSALPVVRDTSYNAWVTIQVGCDNKCAFCIVPAVRGAEMSRPFADIVAEVERLAAAGVTEVTLLGQNVNSYGRDLQLAARHAGDITARIRPLFADLLRAAGDIPGIRRVRYTSPHPKDMRPETFAAMADTAAVCEHLHYPLQSGSDRVLAAMHRGYTSARYLDRLTEARATIPDLAVTTDIIVGFPGETDDDFERTLDVAAAAEFDDAYTFIFSPRPGTEAAEMHDRFVDPATAGERFERLRVVIERSALAKHEARVGSVEDVLVTGPSKRDPDVLSARTRQNKLVHFAPAEPVRPGSYATVEITSAAPHFLRGRLVDVLADPTHKVRIPLALG